MKVRITRPTIAKKRGAMPGDVLDVSQEEGIQLISAGKAVAIADLPVETTQLPSAAVETTALATEHELPAQEEAKPKRGKSKKAGD